MAGRLARAPARKVGTPRGRARARRHMRIRKKIRGTETRPRLVVTRSSRHISAQVVDDTRGHTMVSASTLDGGIRRSEGEKSEKARQVGRLLAQRASDADVETVVFDRAGYKYHGRVAALADAARENGLAF